MPFYFKKSESPSQAAQRLCRKRIDEARGQLEHSERPEAIHGVRKEIKKLRAIFRLVRGEIKQNDYKKNMKALRVAADCLAASRDSRVTLRAFEKLTGRSQRFAGVEKALQKYCKRASRRFQKHDSAAQAERLLRKTGRRVDKLKIEASGWAALEPGVDQAYSRGQASWEAVRQEPSAENFHEWRRHVKDLWYHLRLLCPNWPAATRDLVENLKFLGDQLGDDHDLDLLKQFLVDQCDEGDPEGAALNKLIAARQKKLRASALKLGAQLYAESPAAFCRRLGAEWNDWHTDSRR